MYAVIRIRILLCVMLLCFVTGTGVQAGNSFEAAGDVLTFLLPVTAVGLAIAHKDGEGALQFGASAAIALGVTYGLKNTIEETRPDGDSRSFPSAHTSASFATAEYMRKRYGWEYGVPAYAVATFVAVSRVEAKEHFVHDVLAGATIGILSSYLFTSRYKGWNVLPDVDRKYYGMRLNRAW